MILRSALVTALIISSLQAQANNVFQSPQKKLYINQCSLKETYEQTDLALMNDGFFVLSSAKQNEEFSFTRYGKLYIDSEDYLRVDMGNYLLGMTDESNPEHLTKIKVPREIAPQTTHQVEIQANLDANAQNKSIAHFTAYDAQFKAHKIHLELTKTANNQWSANALDKNNLSLAQGTLVFNDAGKLMKQSGLEQIQMPVSSGVHEFKIHFAKTTQYNQNFRVFVKNDGHGVYRISQMYFGLDGELYLISSNGIVTTIDSRLAVAKFSAPQYLEKMNTYVYQPTNESGKPMIHGLNSFHSILAGFLEEESCLVN